MASDHIHTIVLQKYTSVSTCLTLRAAVQASGCHMMQDGGQDAGRLLEVQQRATEAAYRVLRNK